MWLQLLYNFGTLITNQVYFVLFLQNLQGGRRSGRVVRNPGGRHIHGSSIALGVKAELELCSLLLFSTHRLAEGRSVVLHAGTTAHIAQHYYPSTWHTELIELTTSWFLVASVKVIKY